MSQISYLPHTSAKNNNTRQMRRRTNDLVSVVAQQIGSITPSSGDLGTLNTTLQTKAPSDSPTFTGTVSQPTLNLTAAATSTTASAGGASALPSTPSGYAHITINGQTVKIPYFLP
jgi:hypothetical protein